MTRQATPQEDKCNWPRCRRPGAGTANFDGLDGYRACDQHWDKYHRKVEVMLDELGPDWPNFEITASAGLHRLRVFYICPGCRAKYGPFGSVAEARTIDCCQNCASVSTRKKPKFKV